MHDAFIAHLHDLFADFGAISTRAMFGGHGVYHDGVIIGIVVDDTLYLKTDEATRADFERAGGAPFFYSHNGRQLTMSYWSLPEEAMDAPRAMLPWARLAYDAAMRKAAARRNPGLRRKGGGPGAVAR